MFINSTFFVGQIIQQTALQWMKTFLELAGAPLLPFTANILTAILPCLSYDSEKMVVKHVASEVNQQLKLLITPENDVLPDDTMASANTLLTVNTTPGSHGNQNSDDTGSSDHEKKDVKDDSPPLNMVAVLEVLLKHTNHRAQDTRIETLNWLLWLHQQVPKRTYLLADKLFPSLMNLLSDNSDKASMCIVFVFLCDCSSCR